MRLLEVFRAGGREPSRATLAARGSVFLAVLAVVVASLYLVGRGTFADTLPAVALVDDAGGSLTTGADVKYEGVIVGHVSGLTRAARRGSGPAGVEVALALDPDLAERVPGDVRARILPASVFGTSFVDLVSAGHRGGGVRAGQVIGQDSSRETLEVQNVLDGLDRVVGSLGPARLAKALEGLAGALDGNGEQLGRTIVRVDRYLAKLNPQMPLLRRNLELLATNLEAFEDYAPDLFRATDDALVAARTLIVAEQDFAGLVTSGATTFRHTDLLLRDNRAALAATLVRTGVVVDALYDGRRDVVQGVLNMLRLAGRFSDALSHGRYLRIDGDLVLQGDDPYGPAGCPSYGSLSGRGC
jgi:phospholipid/cholesterol/gamma-HCH transport system substrate-binding protein